MKKEEAIKILKDFHDESAIFSVRTALETLYPEFRESEDERIRGAIIDHLKDNNLTEWAAWLEKQKDCVKLSDSAYTSNRNVIEFADTYSYTVWEKLMDKFKKNENYNIGCNDVSDIVLNAIINTYNWLEKQGEQKPNANCLLRWSKEDEKMFQSLEDIVGDYWAKAEQEKNEIKIREASDISYFLKTIQKSPLCWIKCSDGLPNKDGTYLVVTDGTHNDVYDLARYDSIDGWHKASEIIYWMPIPQLNNKSIIEQKSAEWSEEDEKMLNHIIGLLEGLPILHNWLKSLKQRIGWKPSDERCLPLQKAR